MKLSTMIKNIQDIMRKDIGIDSDAQRIGQIAWMLFLKIYDDQERLAGTRSLIPDNLRWNAWAGIQSHLTGDKLIEFVNNELFCSLIDLSTKNPHNQRVAVLRDAMSAATNYMQNGILMRQVIDKINNLHFELAEERHILGDIYEHILGNLQNAGNAGEFYTPRAITQFMTDIVKPKIGEIIIDPACGTGGFLACAVKTLQKQIHTPEDESIGRDFIRGIEKKPLPHLLCLTNMLLQGLHTPTGIRRANALERNPFSYSYEEQVDVVLTNPPFGGMEEADIEAYFPSDIRTAETADLFMFMIIQLLKKGGRAAVVLPDGFLFGEGTKTRIKQILLTECNLHTVIKLPKGVFSPYTDISTNIIFFTKGETTREIWYYEHPYPPGYKSYSKTRPIRGEEFNFFKEWWNQPTETEYTWCISYANLRARNYNLDFKNPNFRANGKLSQIDLTQTVHTYQSLLRETSEMRSLIVDELCMSIENKTQHTGFLRDNFSLLTQTSSDIQKFRTLILQLAMRGLLVAQDDNESSAQDLIDHIHVIKRQVLLQDRQKQSNSSFLVSQQHTPFSIPPRWKWVTLGDIGKIVGGGTPDTNREDYFSEEGIPWLTPADLYKLKGKYVGRGKRDLSPLGLQKSSARLLPKGAVLFSSRAPIGYVAIAANELATNQGFKSCIPYIMDMNNFIYYFLKFAAKSIEEEASGTTFKEVSGKDVQKILIPLPPLCEQKRIVSKIDHVVHLLDRLEELIFRKEEVRLQSVDALIYKIGHTQIEEYSKQTVDHELQLGRSSIDASTWLQDVLPLA